MARHINPSNSTNKAIDALDRKRERERRFILNKARENAPELAVKLVQRLLDEHILETHDLRSVQQGFERQLIAPADMEEFEIRLKIANIRSLVPNPNILSLYLTAYIIEDLINQAHIQDVFGDDLDVYTAVDAVISTLRPQ
jgi:HEPN domain-containing protein